MRYIIRTITFITIILVFLVPRTYTQEKKRINIGYFEAGHYPVHSLLRDEYFKQLQLILPDEYEVVSIPEAFRSAEWSRETSKRMARQLNDIKHLDILLAFGPWVIDDLIEAGFKKPIIGLHQFNPKAEGYLDDNNRPIAENLTVHFRPGKTLDDVRDVLQLFNVKRLGVLAFPSDNKQYLLTDHIKSLGQQFGFEVITAEEFDNVGTFAFFKSYNKIRGQIDALYLPPLWGLDAQQVGDFFEMLNREKVPSFTDEGGIILEKGATATNNYFGVVSEARFHAVKTVDIIKGNTPADLPVIFRSGFNLAVNQKSAELCQVTLPSDVLNNYQIIGQKSTEHIETNSLKDLVNRALYQNPDYLSVQDALDAIEQEVGIVKADYLPQLSANLAMYRLDDNTIHNSGNSLDENIYSASLNLSQSILSLESIKAVKAAKQKALMAETDQRTARLALELAISLAYLDNLRLSEQMAVTQNLRTILSYNLETARAIVTIDGKDSLDVNQLENARYDLSLNYISQKRALENSRILLNSLLNLPATEMFLLDNSKFTEDGFLQYEYPIIGKVVNETSQNELMEKLESVSFSQNPKMNRAEYAIEWQKALLEKTKASFFPRFGLRASLFYDDYLRESDMFEEKKSGWFVGGEISLPLFLGGSRLKEKSRLKSKISEAEYQKDAVALDIMHDGRTQFQKFLTYTEQMTPAYLAKQRAFNSVELVVDKFAAGEISATDFIAIINNALDADHRAIDTRYNYYASMAQLIHTAGIDVGENYSDFVEQFHQLVGY